MRWQWVYNMKRKHSTINTTPMEKLLSYKKLPKYVAIFPLMNLDNFQSDLQIFFPKSIQSGDGDFLTNDLIHFFNIKIYVMKRMSLRVNFCDGFLAHALGVL